MAESKRASASHISIPLLFVAVIVSFVIGVISMYVVSLLLMSQKSEVADTTETQQSFDVEYAHIQGTVVDFSDQTISIKNKAGQTTSYPLGQPLFVSKPEMGNSKSATSSGDIKMLEKDKPATVNFTKIDGEYKVVSVLYNNFTLPLMK